jgi:signal transduction histidine kinase
VPHNDPMTRSHATSPSLPDHHGATVAAWWPWLVMPAVATGLVSAGLVLVLTYADAADLADQALVNIPLALGFTTVAAGIWSTRPDEPGVRRLAWLYTVVGLGSALVLPAYGWASAAEDGATAAAWLSSWVWALGAPPLLALGLLLYPDGRLPSPRWWPAPVLGVAALTALCLRGALTPGPAANHPSLSNPSGIGTPAAWDVIGTAGFLGLLGAAAAGLAALVRKYAVAPSGSPTRQQIAGFAAAGALVVVAAALPEDDSWGTALLGLAAGIALPLAVGNAVVRHRLLDRRAEVADLHDRVETLAATRRDLVSEREEERARLRRELHDGVGPSLAAIALGLRQLGHRAEEATDTADTATIAMLGDELQRAVAEVRRICEGLRPGALYDLGLVGALRAAVEPLQQVGPAVRVSGEVGSLPPATEVAAYRIAMEAVTNALRHGSPDAVEIRLVESHDSGRWLRVVVEDDGAGFRADRVRAGVGIGSMTERAQELGGTLVVDTLPGHGTAITAWLPSSTAAPPTMPATCPRGAVPDGAAR